jgi:hypothetical protein
MSRSQKFTQHTKPPRFVSGSLVHVHADHPEWGRIASDGTVIEVSGRKALVHVESIKADVIVKLFEISLR